MASRISQRAAGYRAAGKASQSCATCDCFQPDMGMCSLVAGTVSGDYTCNNWVALSLEEKGHDDMDDGYMAMSSEFQVTKSDEALQLVFGWLNISKTTDGREVVDSWGDVIDAGTLEVAAYDFVLSSRASGVDHNDGEAVGVMVESMYFSEEKIAALGLEKSAVPVGWWGGFYIHDADVFKSVVNGDRTDFSIQGKAVSASPDEGE